MVIRLHEGSIKGEDMMIQLRSIAMYRLYDWSSRL